MVIIKRPSFKVLNDEPRHFLSCKEMWKNDGSSYEKNIADV